MRFISRVLLSSLVGLLAFTSVGAQSQEEERTGCYWSSWDTVFHQASPCTSISRLVVTLWTICDECRWEAFYFFGASTQGPRAVRICATPLNPPCTGTVTSSSVWFFAQGTAECNTTHTWEMYDSCVGLLQLFTAKCSPCVIEH